MKVTLVLALFALVSCTKEVATTEERAKDMFRAPSSDEPREIKEKFQPIDHRIKGTEKDQSEKK